MSGWWGRRRRVSERMRWEDAWQATLSAHFILEPETRERLLEWGCRLSLHEALQNAASLWLHAQGFVVEPVGEAGVNSDTEELEAA